MPVKFFDGLGSNERGIFSPLVIPSPKQKNHRSEKIGIGSTTKKIKNPEWRTNAIHRFLA